MTYRWPVNFLDFCMYQQPEDNFGSWKQKTGARVITLLTVEFFRLFLDLPFFGTLFGFSELELFSSLLLAVEGPFENWTPFSRFLWRLLTYFIFLAEQSIIFWHNPHMFLLMALGRSGRLCVVDEWCRTSLTSPPWMELSGCWIWSRHHFSANNRRLGTRRALRHRWF